MLTYHLLDRFFTELSRALQSTIHCSHCCYVTEMKWTEKFRACQSSDYQAPACFSLTSQVGLLTRNGIFLSDEFHFPFGRPALDCTVRLSNRRNVDIRAYTEIPIPTPKDLYLLHASCLWLIQSLAGKPLSLTSLFCLCQSLQPDLSRNFRGFESQAFLRHQAKRYSGHGIPSR